MIQLSAIIEESIVDGPGLRFVVFVQGCSRHCAGCHNEHTHDPSKGYPEKVSNIYEAIKNNRLIRNVTYSGGEPFEQPLPLIKLSGMLKKENYHIMAYTGYLYEELLENPVQRDLLGFLDILVDGPFEYARKSSELRFKGSSNQRIIDVPQSLTTGQIIRACSDV